MYKGEIQSRMLGFALDTHGGGPSEPGELVCREAFPIQPLGFWPLPGYGHDEPQVAKAQERFQESYFKDNEGTWCESALLTDPANQWIDLLQIMVICTCQTPPFYLLTSGGSWLLIVQRQIYACPLG